MKFLGIDWASANGETVVAEFRSEGMTLFGEAMTYIPALRKPSRREMKKFLKRRKRVLTRKQRMKVLKRIHRWKQKPMVLCEGERDAVDAFKYGMGAMALAGKPIPNYQRRAIEMAMNSDKHVLVVGGYQVGKTEVAKLAAQITELLHRGEIRFPTEPAREFEQKFLCEPTRETDRERELRELAVQYHEETDSFDAIHCRARSPRGTPIPVTPEEVFKCGKNAKEVRARLSAIVYAMGFSPKEWQAAISREVRQ